jgi:hypothetical protein
MSFAVASFSSATAVAGPKRASFFRSREFGAEARGGSEQAKARASPSPPDAP